MSQQVESRVGLNIETRKIDYERRFPLEMALLRAGGVYPGEAGPHLNPYTREQDEEYFGNIGEHCIAVAFAAETIERTVHGDDSEAHDEVVRHALVHDAAKRYEIARRNTRRAVENTSLSQPAFEAIAGFLSEQLDPELMARLQRSDQETDGGEFVQFADLDEDVKAQFTQQAGSLFDVYSPKAYEAIIDLVDADLDPEFVAYLQRSGRETGHNSLPQFVQLDDVGKPVLITNNLPDMIVHLADDMTFTSIVKAGERAETHFLTIEERMAASNFPERYPFLYEEGLGFDSDGNVVKVDEVSDDHPQLRHVRTYAEWQVWVAHQIADYLVNEVAGLNQSKPSEYLKQQINLRLSQDSTANNIS
jgi:hypothetical protein